MTIPYPSIPPTILSIGPFALRWYGVMYALGYMLGYRLALGRIRRGISALTEMDLDALIAYLVIGMLAGARLVYVFVYDFPTYRAHPFQALAVWKGGLSFHGAIVGMAIATAVFARHRRLRFLAVTDLVALAGTPGLFLGRIGNFINGELYGRPTSVPWAMVFPTDPLHLPRHPSQLYEAVTEGIVLALVLWILDRRARAGAWQWDGLLTGTFLVGYATARFLLEFTRQPDARLGIVIGPFSMGQLLSMIMLVAGMAVLAVSRREFSTRQAERSIHGIW